MGFRKRKILVISPPPSSALQQTISDLRNVASDLRRTEARLAEQVDRLRQSPEDEEQSAR